MNFFEQTLLELGFSWTISKILPYVVFSVLGFLVFMLLNRRFQLTKFKKTGLLVLGTVIGFVAYFIYSPIYQGDFSNESVSIHLSAELSKFKEKELVVITIPGCPYCAESVDKMKALKKLNPKLKISYLVCSKQAENLTPYKQLINNSFKVQLAENPEFMANVSKRAFPSFLLIDGANSKHWSNQNFGVRAIDYVNESFNN